MDKPRLDQGPDYERGFIDGMMYQTQTTVNKAVAAMAVRTHTPEDVQKIMKPWVGLTKEERHEISMANKPYVADIMAAHEAKLKEKNT
jgi:hypothetical protein